MNPLDTLLQPLHGLDIAATYQRHGAYIDFVIYLVVFTGLSHFVYTKRFPGRAGKAISIGISLALSTAMTVFSQQTGFRLGNLGGIAGMLLLAMFALMVFTFIKQLGGHTTNSGLVAFIAAYMITRAAFPEVYQWIQHSEFAQWLDATVLLAVPVLLVILLLRAKSKLRNVLGKNIPDVQRDTIAERTKQNELGELWNAKREERESSRAEKRAARKGKQIGRNIDSIIQTLKREGTTHEATTRIQRTLRSLQREDTEQANALNRLKLLNEKLQRWDIQSFRTLSDLYRRLSPQEQAKLKTAIQNEQRSILKTKSIQETEQKITNARQDYLSYLNRAINALGHYETQTAIDNLLGARKAEGDLRVLLDQIRHIHKQMLKLTRGETRILQELRR